MASTSRGRKAWLVTWEHMGDHARPERKIAAVFRPQLSGPRVRDLVELLYAAASYAPFEQMEIALGMRRNPYPAQSGDLNGVPWDGEVFCGHNPWLHARLVDKLLIPPDGEPSWKERARPQIRGVNA